VVALKNLDLLVSQFNPFNGTQLCTGEDPDLFFPEDYRDVKVVEKAKAVCRDCWMQADCLKYALSVPNLEGIWAATTPSERRKLNG
jgi:WhiB family redox-sensing transcriptional regulator